MKRTETTANKKKATEAKSFPIVAIGASSGGLEAVSVLFQNLTANTGMAYIYVQHLSRHHKSMLTSLLSKSTRMPVQNIDNMELIEPNHVYVIPHDKIIRVVNGHIQLLARTETVATNLTIDILFSSLAETHKENVIGVILSGNADDGTKGLKAIKAVGGVTMVQDKTAKYTSMPDSAIQEGVADYVLSPNAIARKLMALSKKGSVGHKVMPVSKETILEDNHPDLGSIFKMLQKRNGVDFSDYKLPTIKRRIQRRIVKNNLHSLREYSRFLSTDKDEIEILYSQLLINVTSFFRDAETFRYLKTTVFPNILKLKKKNEPLRIWVPACSTGQEVYSIAMTFYEIQEQQADQIPIQIFATDLSEEAVKVARLGEYSKSDVKSMSVARAERFFTKVKTKYKVNAQLLDMCVFGTSHNILRDPPFSRIDFISCRNLLIYFDALAQKKVFDTLHFSLNDQGYLMLGKSETVGVASPNFTQINSKYRIYSRKKNVGSRKLAELTPRYPRTMVQEPILKVLPEKNTRAEVANLDTFINTALLSDYMPPCAIINKDMEILQFRGSTSLFLSHASGKASLNILKMVKPEFALELRAAILQVLATKQPVHKPGIELMINSVYQRMTLEVSPMKVDWEEPLLLVVFLLKENSEVYPENQKNETVHFQKDQKIKRLTDDLTRARTEIHSIIASQETAYEKLQVANEEIGSSNEEFQTLNEELESTKEEIESAYEELMETNVKLKKHNDLLEESYNYSQTIIATIHEPMIILNSNLRVKSANKSFYKKFSTSKEETEGKLLFELGNKEWDIPRLHELLESILEKKSQFENFVVTQVFPEIGEKVMLLNASRIIQKTHKEKLILLAIKDVTERFLRQKMADGKNEEDIRGHQVAKLRLENVVKGRTKELEQKNKELESANKDLVSFTYISSHDLQEPLRKIRMFVDCIINEEEKNLSALGKNYLHRMTLTVNRMRDLLGDLITYSRTKSDDRVFESIDIKSMLNEIKKDFDEVISSQKVSIKVTNPCQVEVISFQLRQLFHNLISNSLKFSEPDVPVKITVTCKEALGRKFNESQLVPDKKYCHIIFTDNGIGFDPQYKDRIFEVFQRLHSITEFPGTGVGLAICKRIIENHHGVITATGMLHEGARFDMYIPSKK